MKLIEFFHRKEFVLFPFRAIMDHPSPHLSKPAESSSQIEQRCEIFDEKFENLNFEENCFIRSESMKVRLIVMKEIEL